MFINLIRPYNLSILKFIPLPSAKGGVSYKNVKN